MTNDSTHRKKDQDDVANSTITMKVKHMWTIVTTIVGITVAFGMGWFDIKAGLMEAKIQAKEAKTEVASLRTEVATIECLVRQQNEYQMYKRLPVFSCSAIHD